jgi:CelD/BcsL family acetyltransferase involved in cellulose biosynthesis
VKVDLVRADSVGSSDLQTWASWQEADPRLANPFLSAGFAQVAARYFQSVRVAVVSQSGEPVAFWPLSLTRRGVRPVVPGYTDLQGVVHEPLWKFEWRDVLTAMPVGGAQFDHLVQHEAEGLAGVRMAGSPRVDFDAGWDGYMTRLRAEHKNAVTDNARRFRKAGREFQVEFVADDRSEEALNVLMEQKSAQCRRNGWVDVFGPDPIRGLVGAVTRCGEPDLTGRLSTLRFDGAVVAANLTIEGFGTRCNWFSSFDPELSWYRPGWTLSLLCLEAAAQDGCSTFSFGKGDDRYKLTFATATDLVGAGSVSGRGARGRVFAASRMPSTALASVFERYPKTEDALRRGVQELRRQRYRVASR